MKVRLLDPEDDFNLKRELPWQLHALITEDLELDRLCNAMAAGDAFLRDTAKKIVALNITDPDVITYRQQVLTDCLTNRHVVQQIYDIASAVDGVELRHKVFLGGLSSRDPQTILRRSVRIMKLLTRTLRQLRNFTDQHAGQFRSTGLRQLSSMLAEDVGDDYLATVDKHLNELDLPRGVLLSARLGLGNKGERHLLHQPPRRHWWAQLADSQRDSREFVVDDDPEETGAQALAKLAGRSVNDVANTVTQSADDIQNFFTQLRTQLAFYLGCANLHDELTKHQVPTCFPVPTSIETPRLQVQGLRDVGLCLSAHTHITGNTVDADGKTLIVITGANDGGKSTFLRSVGAAQIMMQAGMFVAAEAFTANVRDGVFTHFKREEDATLRHGKLEEELSRLSSIVNYIKPTSLLLCNESFASTNELEGSEIAQGIVDAMIECGVKVYFVTHLYDLAHSLWTRDDPASLFLQAERRPDGVRTFRLTPGSPEPTSHGEDSFREIFGVAPGRQTSSEPFNPAFTRSPSE